MHLIYQFILEQNIFNLKPEIFSSMLVRSSEIHSAASSISTTASDILKTKYRKKVYFTEDDTIKNNPNRRALVEIASKYFTGRGVINAAVDQLNDLNVDESINIQSIIKKCSSTYRPNAKQRILMLNELKDARLIVFEKINRSIMIKKGPLFTHPGT